jgi:addiction module HigA family antidote
MMKNPPHPGSVIKDVCLETNGLTVTQAAKHLQVTRVTLSRLLNEQSGISVDMAYRLAAAFGGSPERWLRLQMQYDLARAQPVMSKLDIKAVTSKIA